MNVLFWNSNVLTSQQACDLHRVMKPLDVVLLVEVGREAPPPCPGFVCFSGVVRQNRSVRGAGRGQGIYAYVRQSLAAVCSQVKCTDYYMWLRFDVPGHGVVYLAAVYMPPASSRVEWGRGDGWVDVYNELQGDIAAYQAQGLVCVFGDFNCHTGVLDDTGSESQQVLDSLAALTGDVPLQSVPPRNSRGCISCLQHGAVVAEFVCIHWVCDFEWQMSW